MLSISTELQNSNEQYYSSNQNTDDIFQKILKTREIIIRSDIPRSHSVTVYTGGACILGLDSIYKYDQKRDFNDGILRNLSNTRDVIFSILDRTTGEFHQLEIPDYLSEKLGEYLRNMQQIETNEQYRLPGGLKNYPVNCKSFVYYIKGWFDNPPTLSLKYLKNKEDGNNIVPGDVFHISQGDEGSGEYWHYMIYLGDGFCISKNGHSNIVITRHHLKGLYRVIEK